MQQYTNETTYAEIQFPQRRSINSSNLVLLRQNLCSEHLIIQSATTVCPISYHWKNVNKKFNYLRTSITGSLSQMSFRWPVQSLIDSNIWSDICLTLVENGWDTSFRTTFHFSYGRMSMTSLNSSFLKSIIRLSWKWSVSLTQINRTSSFINQAFYV